MPDGEQRYVNSNQRTISSEGFRGIPGFNLRLFAVCCLLFRELTKVKAQDLDAE
jgi:hypothetical protein